MLKEEWKQVPDWEVFYEVSNFGRIRNARTKVLKAPDINNYGYARLQCYAKGIRQKLFVHKLVAVLFIGEPTDNTLVVNHKDSDKLNNFVGNLEWVTRSYNNKHNYEAGTQEKKNVRIPTKLVTMEGIELFFPTIEDLGRSIGLSGKRLAHLYKTQGGYIPEINATFFKCVSND